MPSTHSEARNLYDDDRQVTLRTSLLPPGPSTGPACGRAMGVDENGYATASLGGTTLADEVRRRDIFFSFSLVFSFYPLYTIRASIGCGWVYSTGGEMVRMGGGGGGGMGGRR